MLSSIDSITLENSNEQLSNIQENTFNFGGEVCKVHDMLCHAHVSEPMNRKVYWDLSFVKFHVLGDIVKYAVCA